MPTTTTIDRRISYRIVLDTETCPIDNTINDVDPNNMLVYDIGWAVVDKRGKVYKTRSFVISEIFIGEAERMKSGYYASKLPQYEADIASGSRILTSLFKARQTLLDDIAEFEVTEVYSHNTRFDVGSLNRTENWVTSGKYNYFYPKNIQLCDTMYMANDVVAKTPSYIKFCNDNGFMTSHKTPRPQVKAEVLYRFISRDVSFEESHTGLEDVMIEKEIMRYCFAKHKAMNRFYPKKK